MNISAPRYIYKIITRDLWIQADGTDEVPGMPIDLADGYMHFSTAEQLAKTLELYFAGQKDVVILAVETAVIQDELTGALKWEASRGGALFPHLYAPLPRAAVAGHALVDVGRDGSVELPALVK